MYEETYPLKANSACQYPARWIFSPERTVQSALQGCQPLV